MCDWNDPRRTTQASPQLFTFRQTLLSHLWGETKLSDVTTATVYGLSHDHVLSHPMLVRGAVCCLSVALSGAAISLRKGHSQRLSGWMGQFLFTNDIAIRGDRWRKINDDERTWKMKWKGWKLDEIPSEGEFHGSLDTYGDSGDTFWSFFWRLGWGFYWSWGWGGERVVVGCVISVELLKLDSLQMIGYKRMWRIMTGWKWMS